MGHRMERMPTWDVPESQRTFNVAMWTQGVKVGGRAQDWDKWRD